ncbi:Neutral ceramidase [Pseudolycoriella hygida]|uniref:Neutral ceramidase n=1 Tax=Pseudolycoriella hygida TaxID=35572 RepID=A0A9Q0S6Y0_9DIPT|nr:Neutral ceramidase [Pseudolycoriella hygida]
MGYVKLFAAILVVLAVGAEGRYRIGLGRYDVTGPSVEIAFMGYGSMTQRGIGIHTRQYARAFIIEDETANRVVFVNADISAFSDAMRREIIRLLRLRFGDLYTTANVMFAPTHTHAGPGGYHQLVLYDITCLGFIEETFNPIVFGVREAITRAHNAMQDGRAFYSEVPIEDFGINRSPAAYYANPEHERRQYEEDIDRNLQQIKFVNARNETVGAFHWVATHAVSMNNTNYLISIDNLGYASYLLEQEYNPGNLVGTGTFVGAFSTSNSGDISPNILGPRCYRNGGECDTVTSQCPADDVCKGEGPGETDKENTKIIGSNIYKAASIGLKNAPQRELTGSVGFMHQFVEMSRQTGQWFNNATGRYETFRGCLPAMGTSFAAGTTDGPGAYSFFEQGDTSGNPFWQLVGNSLRPPNRDDRECHAPKPILLMTGRMSWPYLWQPLIVPTQLFKIGGAVILGVPSEMTTMAGRRLRRTIQDLGRELGEELVVLPTGMANTYSSYVVTFEEYQVQRYEGGSATYGPHTLTIYQQQYARLFSALQAKQSLPPGPTPRDESRDQLTFLTPVVMDTGRFGRVLVEPRTIYSRRQVVFVTFVAANPRNDLRTESSYFFVDQLQPNGQFRTIATDANWETKFIWRRTSTLLGQSEIDFYWTIPDNAESGTYRIRHFGASRGILGIRPYDGSSRTFVIN